MKSRLLLLIFIGVSLVGFAQTGDTIIGSLEEEKAGEGTIVVDAEPGINDLIGKVNNRVAFADEESVTKMNGYRVLVYMGNDPKKSKDEAYNRRRKVSEAFVEIETYLAYDSPNWKLLAGDFMTSEEANIFKQKLLKEFPAFGKEAYIVTSIINVPIEN